jgi:hypothetical protein
MYNFLMVQRQEGEEPQPTYKRTVIPDCVWRQDSEATYKSTGTLNADAVKLQIPYDPEYFSVQNGEVFQGDGWTVQAGPELIGSYIVKGVCSYEFPPFDVEPGDHAEPDDSEIEGDQTGVLQDESFFREYIQPFEASNKYKRPKEIIEHFEGTRFLWYVEVRC